MTVGQAIKKARTEKGYTQDKLAKKIGTYGYIISIWENDKAQPCCYFLMRMADVLGISIDKLVGREVVS